jgi:hypothetical protein
LRQLVDLAVDALLNGVAPSGETLQFSMSLLSDLMLPIASACTVEAEICSVSFPL